MVGASGGGTHDAAGMDECAGFIFVDEFDFMLIGEGFFEAGQGVVDLADDHGPGALTELGDEFGVGIGRWVGLDCGQGFEGQGQHGVACEDCGGLSGVLVQRWAASAEIVVVEGWEIVVDQAESVDEFDGDGDGE